MNHSADVVIIGGGVVGSSIALHLKKDGFAGRVVVLERDPTYEFASSFLAMGGVRQQFMSALNVAMVRFSLPLYENNPEFEFHQRGYLFLGNETNWSNLKRRYESMKTLGAAVELLTVADIRRLVPELRTDDLLGGLYGPKDGYVNPRATLAFLRKNAEKEGAEYVADELQRIDIAGGAIKAVHAARAGRIETDRLVIAAGAFSGAIGEIAGIHIPVTPVRQQLFRCTLPRPWTYDFPLVIDPTGVHWRSHGNTEMLTAKTKLDEPPGFNFEGDTDRFYSDFFPDLTRRLPEFRDLKLVRGWGGLYEMTPDHNGIIDEHPEVHGLYLACGFSGHGLMMSPATGKLISELIRLNRFETIDASLLSFSRFERNHLFFDEAMI